ncbi:uncharacterized protein LOC130626080 [Hydractinia symbiolongicarpus]|uniref:uncharacterized protein LOC130626080 n=1 Tax=Hydractinia symbiolongicarpus TaxID=13093 RepID=UPI00254B0F04|nr:uncharacterized protein LOC130626080 [Hydractinia symbiolongicarpus]
MAKVKYYVFLFFIVQIFLTVASLECNYCFSRNSMEDCITNQRKATCRDGSKCFVSETEIYEDHKFYEKGCKKSTQCNPVGVCGSTSGCTFKCCEDHLCNSSGNLKRNYLLFLAAIILSLIVTQN